LQYEVFIYVLIVELFYERKVSTAMVNNSTKINKTKPLTLLSIKETTAFGNPGHGLGHPKQMWQSAGRVDG